MAGTDNFRCVFQPKSFYRPNHCIGIEWTWNCTLLKPGVWAQQSGNKWQTVTAATCVVQKQQGFICECNTVKTQDICLDTEQNVCHFEIHPRETSETVLGCAGNGCVCMRALCASLFIETMHNPSIPASVILLWDATLAMQTQPTMSQQKWRRMENITGEKICSGGHQQPSELWIKSCT